MAEPSPATSIAAGSILCSSRVRIRFTRSGDLDFASELSRVRNSIHLGAIGRDHGATRLVHSRRRTPRVMGRLRRFDGTASHGSAAHRAASKAHRRRDPGPRRWRCTPSHGDARERLEVTAHRYRLPPLLGRALSGGVIPNSAAPLFSSRSSSRGFPEALEPPASPPADRGSSYVSPPDAGVYDGRFATTPGCKSCRDPHQAHLGQRSVRRAGDRRATGSGHGRPIELSLADPR